MRYAVFVITWIGPIYLARTTPFGKISPVVFDLSAISVYAYILGVTSSVLFSRMTYRNTVNHPKHKLNTIFAIGGCLMILIHIYVYYNLQGLPLTNHQLRTEMRSLYGPAWSIIYIYVTIATTFKDRLKPLSKIVLTINWLFLVASGLKLVVLAMITAYTLNTISSTNITYYGKLIRGRKILTVSIITFLLVAASLSIRSKTIYDLSAIFSILYLYIAPNFVNFSNYISAFPAPQLFFGSAIFSGFLPFELTPLSVINEEYLQYKTWNVWSVLFELYVSSGIIEICVYFFLLGYLMYFSLYYLHRTRSASAQIVTSQLFLTHIMLHNQNYLASTSALLLTVIGLFLTLGKYR